MKARNPFIPSERGDIAVVDGRISPKIEENLREMGVLVIKTVRCESTYEAVSYHPDIVMHPVNERDIVVAPSVAEYYKDRLESHGLKVIAGESEIGMDYPYNIGYNVGRVGNFALHNLKYTDPVLKYYLDKENVEWVYVKQGYSKCSLLPIGDSHVLTSDKGIARVLSGSCGVEVCVIEPGGIVLDGMEYGFIGGSGGMISKGELVLSGSYRNHKSKRRIDEFVKSCGVKVTLASNSSIVDLGSIIFLKSRKGVKL
ncbi:hypothetical protein EUAN_00220 [Andreesenia angusta]|uniref:DUF6873 domain-containing protein n=1 Tax=Andreesenia angusta TaxID=39480 RepID=A0A1S1V9T3_9FIRM|nr:hypothetical protein [Andreesenia angusta]OHW63160.1 hypothetical protein EUAN_00220 [Andreesenia angusta]